MTTKTSAVAYDVRWRPAGADVAWSAPQRFKVNAELVINGLIGGKTYNTQARSISNCGAMSAWADQDDLVVPVLNQRLSQGNLNMLRVGGIGSAWTGFAISYTASPTSATISCTSGTLQDGASNPAYAASSAVVSGTAGSTVTYYLYYDDPAGTGGTKSLGTTTTYSALSANQGRIFVGQVDVAFPTSGSGTGGGSPGGGSGPGCVTIDCWVLTVAADGSLVPKRAGDVIVGDTLLLADEVTLAPRHGVVTYSEPKDQPCVEVSTACGARLTCSASAPLPTKQHGLRTAPNVAGKQIAVRKDDAAGWDAVTIIRGIGTCTVQHITCENACFWASLDGAHWVLHHNLKPIGDA